MATDIGEDVLLQTDRIDTLLEAVGDDVYRRLLASFFSEEERMTQSLGSDDAAAVALAAHKVKGTASNLGLGALAHAACRVEAAAKAADPGRLTQMRAAFANTYQETKTACAARFLPG